MRIPACLLLGLFLVTGVADDTVLKSIFVYEEGDGLVASNALTGQFFELEFAAKERLEQKFVAKGVAVAVTSQRFTGIGSFSGGWQDVRRIAGEKFISAEVEDTSALLVTSDRFLTFSGSSGSWSQKKR